MALHTTATVLTIGFLTMFGILFLIKEDYVGNKHDQFGFHFENIGTKPC